MELFLHHRVHQQRREAGQEAGGLVPIVQRLTLRRRRGDLRGVEVEVVEHEGQDAILIRKDRYLGCYIVPTYGFYTGYSSYRRWGFDRNCAQIQLMIVYVWLV